MSWKTRKSHELDWWQLRTNTTKVGCSNFYFASKKATLNMISYTSDISNTSCMEPRHRTISKIVDVETKQLMLCLLHIGYLMNNLAHLKIFLLVSVLWNALVNGKKDKNKAIPLQLTQPIPYHKLSQKKIVYKLQQEPENILLRNFLAHKC